MAFLGRVRAALNGWHNYGKDGPLTTGVDNYGLLWSWYEGTWQFNPAIRAQTSLAPSLYEVTRRIWDKSQRIANFYGQFVYQGDLSTDGQPLPNGSRGAIPIDAQTGNERTDEQVILAFYELFNMWYWQQHMSTIPWLSAILGDCLTEIVDDYRHGKVYPATYWPGFVPDDDLEIDALGHVKRYALEYPVSVAASTSFGRNIQAESFMFRKEVDAETIRFFKDGKPFEYEDENGNPQPAVQPNIYRFVPATWDRHKKVPWSNRGISALGPTMRQTLEINSTLSHALDYQRRQFAMPIGIKGTALGGRTGRTVNLPGGVSVSFPVGVTPRVEDVAEATRRAQTNQHFVSMDESGEFVAIKFDTGDTVAMLQMMADANLAETPEASYGSEIMKMSQVTGPGMERILAPIVGLIKDSRNEHDPQTIKRLQMSTSMMAIRLKRGDIPPDVVRARPSRFAVFEPYDATSFDRGLLQSVVAGRDVFPETPLEKAQRMVLVQQVTDPDLMAQLGRDPEVIDQLTEERRQAAELEATILAGTPQQQDQQTQQDAGAP